MNKKLSAHLETGRISNLPTVWGNVFMAWVLFSNQYNHLNLYLYMLAASLFYVGGCYLGDARDVTFDRQNKPSRPIPSGVLKESTIWIAGGLMMIVGLLISGYVFSNNVTSLFLGTGSLVTVITIYALFHKKSPWLGLPLIGACRGFLVFSALLLVASSQTTLLAEKMSQYNSWLLLAPCIAVSTYTICFASVARLESSDKKIAFPQLLKLLMLALPLLMLPLLVPNSTSVALFSSAYLAYSIWLLIAFKQINTNKGAYVSKCLAGFALLDVVLISPTGIINIIIGLVLFGLALTLQKIAPAT